MITKGLFAAVAVLALAGAAGAQTPGKMDDRTMSYIMAASQSDQFEIREGKLAADHGASPKVRDFGQHMVDAHMQTTTALTSAVQNAGMTPGKPPELRPDQVDKIGQLAALSGPDFDKEYLRQQVAAHEEALAATQDYAMRGNEGPVAQSAQQTVPIIRGHLAKVRSLQASSGM